MRSSEAGVAGEALAGTFLESLGYRILARNFRTRFGELDLVAADGDSLVFVEVKYRRDESFAPAEEHLTASKRRKLLKTGRAAAVAFGSEKNIRFDYVALVGDALSPEIRHYPNVIEGADLG